MDQCQFMPGTWSGHKQDGDGDGKADIMNPYDAVFAAAHLIVHDTDKTSPTRRHWKSMEEEPMTILYAAGAYKLGWR